MRHNDAVTAPEPGSTRSTPPAGPSVTQRFVPSNTIPIGASPTLIESSETVVLALPMLLIHARVRLTLLQTSAPPEPSVCRDAGNTTPHTGPPDEPS